MILAIRESWHFDQLFDAAKLLSKLWSSKAWRLSGAPRHATVRSCMVLAGRFGYSDLKEAALMEAYVL